MLDLCVGYVPFLQMGAMVHSILLSHCIHLLIELVNFLSVSLIFESFVDIQIAHFGFLRPDFPKKRISVHHICNGSLYLVVVKVIKILLILLGFNINFLLVLCLLDLFHFSLVFLSEDSLVMQGYYPFSVIYLVFWLSHVGDRLLEIQIVLYFLDVLVRQNEARVKC